MKARVRYLAALAGQAAGAAVLRPPRQLFAASYSPPCSPGSGGPPRRPTERHEQPTVPRAAARPDPGGEPTPAARLPMATRRGERQGAGRADDAPSRPAIPPAAAAGTEAIQRPLPGQDRPGSAQPLARTPAAGGPVADPDPAGPGPGRPAARGTRAAGGPVADPDPAGPGPGRPAARGTRPEPATRTAAAGTDHGTHEATPMPGAPRPPADVPGRPPTSWADPLWFMPAGVRPATWPGPATDERPLPVPPRPRDAADHATPGGPAAVRDLLPPTGQAAGPGVPPGQEPSGARQPSQKITPARLSIGTIEVTVAAPGPPARTQQVPPAAQLPVSRPRPPSPLEGSAGADRLRDGLRRWYGTAQG